MDYEEVAAETRRIKKPDWLKIITRLHNNFKGYPFDDAAQEPLNAIGAILKTLKPNKHLDEQFKEHLSRLDCFTYRAYYIDTETDIAIYWNPLEIPFSQFTKNKSIQYQADIEYPAPDIIRLWFYQKICSNINR